MVIQDDLKLRYIIFYKQWFIVMESWHLYLTTLIEFENEFVANWTLSLG